MTTTSFSSPASPAPRTRIAYVALICVGALVFLLYGNWLYRVTPSFLQPLWAVVFPLALFTSFLNPVFSSVTVLVAAYLACFSLVGMAWRYGKVQRRVNAVLVGGIFCALAFPFFLPALYGPYEPYAQPATGYEMRWLTQPANMWGSAFKSAQRAHEKAGCTYTLRGWTADNLLYFGSDCGSEAWQYDPLHDTTVQRMGVVPELVEGHSSVSREITFGNGARGYPTRPAGFEPVTHDHFIVYETATSPGGQWVAATIMDFYGPRDVVLLSAAQGK